MRHKTLVTGRKLRMKKKGSLPSLDQLTKVVIFVNIVAKSVNMFYLETSRSI
jgi:hypothetical protein